MQVSGTARLLALVAIGGLLYGGIAGYANMVAINAGILLWLGVEAIWFQLVVCYQRKNSTIVRRISDRAESVRTLWEGKPYDIETRVTLASGLGGIGSQFLKVTLTDLYPNTFRLLSGAHQTFRAAFAASPNSDDHDALQLKYHLEAREIGLVRFDGVRAEFESPTGLFSWTKILRHQDQIVVAPRVFQIGSTFPLLKQDNRISPPGVHTHRHAGSGSELLEIREYQPGDPPKSIAWKLTARRDQLMSKQFESEVPLRCTLFIDTSASTYLRANQPPVIQPFVRVASTLIEFLTASRDPVGVVTFDAKSYQVHRHSAARRSALRTIRSLTQTVTNIPKIERAASNVSQLIRLGLSLAQELYPAMHAASGHGFGLQVWTTLRLRRPHAFRRYRMAAILCSYYGTTSHTLGELLYNDATLVGWLQKFLLDHNRDLGASRSELDLENVADPRKVTNLTRLLRHAVARSQDQERFVILADLLHVADHLSPLASAIRMAQAQGHGVSVVCAWDPSDLAGNENDVADNRELPKATRKNARELFAITQSSFLNRRFQQLQHELARAQVRVVGVHERTAMQQVLVQLQMAQPGRIAT